MPPKNSTSKVFVVGLIIALSLPLLLIPGLLAQNANPPPSDCTDHYLYFVGDGHSGGTTNIFCIAPDDVTPVCLDSDSDRGCPECPPGTGGGGGVGGGGPGGGPGGASGPGGCGSCRRPGMAWWWVSEPELNVWLKDRPLFYQPSRGPQVVFRLDYKNVPGPNGTIDNAQPYIFSVGTNWHSPWRSYIQQAGTNEVWFVFLGDGSARQYGVDFVDYYSRGQLHKVDTDHYTFTLNTGVKYTYNNPATLNTNSFNFLSKIEDANGNGIDFTYSTATNRVRLSQITDPDGRTTTFSYTNFGPYSNLISQVSGPYGLTVQLIYNGNGQLTNITDVMGLRSSMQYDGSSRLSKLMTPYGTNAFEYYGGATSSNWSALRVTEMGVRQQLYVQGALMTNVLPTASNQQTSLVSFVTSAGLTQSFERTEFDLRNSVVWGARQYGNLSSTIRASLDNGTFDPATLTTYDYRKGRLRHWLKDSRGYTTGKTLSLQRDPGPLADGSTEGQLTWYDYWGKTNVNGTVEGTNMVTRYEARLDPSGSWRAVYTERNPIGKPLTVIQSFSDTSGNPAWRTNHLTYSSDGIDVLSMQFGAESFTVRTASS